jgi:hypothetical protein
MPSIIYNSFLRDVATGAVDLDSDTFKVILVTSGYVANKDTHTKRSNITNEVTGTGYTATGVAIAITVPAVDLVNDRLDVALGAVTWPSSTITARGAVVYKSRGGLATADELVAFLEFPADVVSTAADFSLQSSFIRYAN